MIWDVSAMEQSDINPPKSEKVRGDSHPRNAMVEAGILGSLLLDYR